MKNVLYCTIDEKNCSGCGACTIACPKKCIEMEQRSLGHLFPKINESVCINCGKCKLVCPTISDIREKNNYYKQTAFAAYSKNNVIRSQGSSGGIFGTIANILLTEGYSVYGAAFGNDLTLKCTCARNKNELIPLYKSKYLQSDLTGKYCEIKEKLDNGEKVLFVSTPCQVKAIKLFLGNEYTNLVTIDFFCHGVPSQEFFNRCIQFENKKIHGIVQSFQFRTKVKNGATPHYYAETVDCEGQQKDIIGFYFYSPFYAFFQKYINLRESCYNCLFSGMDRNSDITIGDFHEVNHYISGINRFDGVSLVVVDSLKGKRIISSISDSITSFPLDIEQLMKDSVCFNTGTERPKQRDEFLHDFNTMTMEALISKWVNPKYYFKHRLYYKMPLFMRNIFKQIVGFIK